jgi:diguanylate cyclase (GGDEF)-like protein
MPQEFKRWVQAIDDFARLLGLTLVVYDNDEYLLTTGHASNVCSSVQLEPKGLRMCEADCGSMLSHASAGGEFVSFKCHAHLYNFAAPIRIRGKVQYVLLGGRIFRNYQDFAAFDKEASNYGIKDLLFVDWDNATRFESPQYFQCAVSFIQSLVDSTSESPMQRDYRTERTHEANTLYELSALLGSQESPQAVFQLMFEALSVLFDVSAAALLRRTVDRTEFEIVRAMGSLFPRSSRLSSGAHPALEDLELQYLYFEEVYTILKMGFSETVRSIHSFPIMDSSQTGWVLQIYNTLLCADTVKLLRTFCQHVAGSLDRIFLRQEVSDCSTILSTVAGFNTAISSELRSHDLYRAILLKTIEIMKAEQGSLLIFDETSGELAVKFIKGVNEKLVETLRLRPGQGIAGMVFESGQPLLVTDISVDARFHSHERARYKTKSFLSVPLKIRARSIGVLNVTDKINGAAFAASDLKLLDTIAKHACIALERSNFYEKAEDLRRISITDSLTDVYNRRFFQDRLAEELGRAKRHSHALSLIILDIDNFKNYNDAYGHLAGDEVLRVTSAVLKSSVRNIDVVARFGGEEFAVILPVTEAMAAQDIAERIRHSFASRFLPDHSALLQGNLSMSLGIACFPKDSGSVLELIGNADKALYRAKLSGKNRVSIFDRAESFKSASGL